VRDSVPTEPLHRDAPSEDIGAYRVPTRPNVRVGALLLEEGQRHAAGRRESLAIGGEMAKPQAGLQLKVSTSALPLSTPNTERSCADDSSALGEPRELTSPRTRDAPRPEAQRVVVRTPYRHSRYLSPTRTAIDALTADKMKMDPFIMMKSVLSMSKWRTLSRLDATIDIVVGRRTRENIEIAIVNGRALMNSSTPSERMSAFRLRVSSELGFGI